MKKRLVGILVAAALMQACGGGDSSPAAPAKIISGVAAAGAPLAGMVTVKDSLGATKSVAIGSNGKYSVDVSGMTAPFMFRAEGTVGGRSYVIHSAATSADINGNINITPLTDLIIANIANQIATSYFQGGNFTNLTAAELANEETLLQARLQAIFTAVGIDSTIDILRSSFSPDHTQLDAALDILRVETNPATGIATITNLLTSETISDDVTLNETITLTDTSGIAGALTELQAITQTFTALTSLYATALPTNTAVEALLDIGFLHSDSDRATFAADISSSPDLLGATFGDIAVVALDTTAGTATVDFTVTKSGYLIAQVKELQMKRQGDGSWLMLGNQRTLDAYFHAHTVRSFNNSSTPADLTGIELWLENPQAGNDGGTIDHVVISGPGLGSGIRYIPDPINASNVYLIEDSGGSDVCLYQTTPYCVMTSDTTIQAIADNAVYTITVYDAGNTVLATYQENLPKRPYLNSELGSLAFPVVSLASMSAFLSYAGGPITLSAALPTWVTSAWGHLDYVDSAAQRGSVEEDKYGLKGSVSLSTSFTIANPPITRLTARLSYKDAYQREIMTEAVRGM